MAPGIILVIVGAILAFAVRKDTNVLDVQTVGLIFMLAGAAIMAYARREKRAERVVRKVEHHGGTTGAAATHETVTHELVTEDSGDLESHAGEHLEQDGHRGPGPR